MFKYIRNMEWTTERIEAWKIDPKSYERDFKLEVILNNEKDSIIDTPLINGFRSDILFNYTSEEISNIIKLNKDPLIINKYQPLKLRDYQKEMLEDISKNRFSILNVARQIGTNMVVAHHVLHYCLSNYDKVVQIFCINNTTCDNLYNNILDLLCKLPYHLQVGIKDFSLIDRTIHFSNGTRLIFTSNNTIGYNIDYLILPEFAFNTSSDKVITILLPTLYASSKSKILIYSCPNKKDDCFHKMFIDTDNVFYKNTYPYTIMNLPNDDIFRTNMVAMFGEGSFITEYECLFPGTSEYRDRKLQFILNKT